jgi:hypothetical protein
LGEGTLALAALAGEKAVTLEAKSDILLKAGKKKRAINKKW